MSQALTLARPTPAPRSRWRATQARFAAWSDALGFAARVAADPQVAALLGNPQLTPADAVDAAVAAEWRRARRSRSFLALLADNRRLALLPEIAGLFDELRAEAERVVKAHGHLGRGAAGRRARHASRPRCRSASAAKSRSRPRSTHR